MGDPGGVGCMEAGFMSAVPSLRVTTGIDAPTPLADLFHRVNRLLPEDQQVFPVASDTTVRKALEMMRELNFSQLPVIDGREVLGIFSHRSLTAKLLDIVPKTFDPSEMTVGEAMEIVDASRFVHIKHEFRPVFDMLDRHDAVLVGALDHLQGIVTPMDVLRYLESVAIPFMLIEEIELSVRALIRKAVSDDEIEQAAREAIKDYNNKPKDHPTQLEKMTFNNYVQIVGHDHWWKRKFEPVFRGDRNRMRTRLEKVGELRNVVFHFRRELTVDERQKLSEARDWLLMRSRAVDGGSPRGSMS